MAEQWIIRVQGKEYGPADLATLHEWKSEGRVLPSNPARQADVDLWKTAGEIPGLFPTELPPVQAEVPIQRSEINEEKVPSKPPSRNVFVETFRIYFRGFFQFLGLALLSIVPILCAEFASRFIDAEPSVNPDLRTLVAWAFGMSMLILRIVLIPVYVAGIQILSVELATGQRIGFLGILNGAVKYWPRVAGVGLFVWGVFFLLFFLALVALGVGVTAVFSPSLLSMVLGLAAAFGLLAFLVWLFCRFFINVLFWQQLAVLENLNATDALRESRSLARSGRDLPWHQRPMWRGAFIVSFWYAFIIALSIVVLWPRLVADWPMMQDYFNQIMQTQDPQAVLQKLNASLQAPHGFDYRALALSIGERILQPLLGIAFVVLYLDCRPKDEG